MDAKTIDAKDLRIADLKAEVMTLRAQLQEVIDPRWILHIRSGGIVASSIKDPLENGDYYIVKMSSKWIRGNDVLSFDNQTT